ncbi:hypothetical protein ENSA5_14400 [Enhygromyxa salina]|uniref:Lipoprotein n=1 Tax=Enhygromyxa salina TaxID=215803 RepID=A0A2S9YEX3_9BACT|nr:hypothetical protein [Enhygromyxa salina]PRQ03566.1 hypothetical protein ENSA5_14400 [Enhygromyxa salina]
MSLRSVTLASALVVGLALTASCRGVEPPYPPGKAPEVADLLAATAPASSAIQVPRAKVRQGAGPAASLMLVAQAPARFSGTIQISGNELVTLVVNEDEYGLRWVGGREGRDALEPGYYSGPPSRCAVETLLGVDLEPEAFVNMVLGGAPLIDEPHQVLGRKWDRKAGRERLRIANGDYEQELAFAWVDAGWRFAGATLWATGGGGEPTWLWTIDHTALHEVEGEILPHKTQIRRPKPKGKGELVINVSFQKQVPNPALGGELSADPPSDADAGGGGETGDEPANAGDGWDDDWGDEEEEEGEGGGPGDAAEAPAAAEVPTPPPIPPQFVGNPTGLTPRGDLCAGR